MAPLLRRQSCARTRSMSSQTTCHMPPLQLWGWSTRPPISRWSTAPSTRKAKPCLLAALRGVSAWRPSRLPKGWARRYWPACVAQRDAKDLVLFDLAQDLAVSGRVAIAKADQAPAPALAAAAGLFQMLGKIGRASCRESVCPYV